MSADPELELLRKQMDDVNRRLVDALHERANVARRIGVHKRAAGLASIDPARELQMRRSLLQDLPADGFSEPALTAILDAVFEQSRRLVQGS